MPQDVGTINIEAHEDTDLLYEFPTTRDSEGVLVDALWSGRMQVRDKFDLLKFEAAVTVSSTGKPQAYIRRQDLGTPGLYLYDLILRNPLGFHFKRYSGGLKVQPTVTEWSDPAPEWIPPTIGSPDPPNSQNVWASAHPETLMPQSVGTIDIEAHEDTDLLYEFPTTRDGAGALVDALWSGRMQVRDKFDLLKFEAAVTVSDTGKPLVYIRRQDLGASGQYLYDLILKSPLGLHFKRYSGALKVRATVTEWSDPAPEWFPPSIGSPAAIADHNASPSAHPDLRGRSSILLNVEANNQTVFALPINPPAPTRTSLMVNGVEYDFLDSYSLSNYQLTWLNNPFQLKPGYRVKLYY
jgi:hypothetical protein